MEFATFKDGAIIADEMGLGKTIQAIATAIMKKQIFGFTKTLIICPASLKKQWQNEITKFSNEKSIIAEGLPPERNDVYKNSDAYFVIVNYETVLRDWYEINKMDTDFIILDEAQRIKNLAAVTSQSIKLLKKKHALVITCTPIENKLIDLYSITQFINPFFLAPLWEFSYQHCYFDEDKKDKINGYYNLQQLNERLNEILLRREKRKVLKELPRITEITVPVQLSPEQASYHADFARGVSAILRKKFITPFDQQKLMLLLGSMRMVCDSTYLIDKQTNISPKLTELKHILLEKLDIKNKSAKILIFSEWVTMLNIIAKMLHSEGIGYAQLTGKVAVKNRSKLINKFE
ncbi:MAG: DEAD/DEAH box helicase, partial [Chitinophagaceae bacterium]|nr:DEAD/DEAH box helicase [Chitinophagaceae bacterium]